MKKKILGLAVSTVALSGVTGCSLLMVEEDTGFGEIAELEYAEVYSYGVQTETVFNKMNELSESLNLDTNNFEASYYEFEGEEFLEGYNGLVSDGVMVSYVPLIQDEWWEFKDKSSEGFLQEFSVLYDKTNPNAVHYVNELVGAFNEIALTGIFEEEAHELSRGFKDYTLSLEYLEDYDEADLLEEELESIEKIGADSLDDVAMVHFY